MKIDPKKIAPGTKMKIVLHNTMNNVLKSTVKYPYVDRTWIFVIAAFAAGFVIGYLTEKIGSLYWGRSDPDNSDVAEKVNENLQCDMDENGDIIACYAKEPDSNQNQSECENDNEEKNTPTVCSAPKKKEVMFSEWVKTESGEIIPLQEKPKPLSRDGIVLDYVQKLNIVHQWTMDNLLTGYSSISFLK
ncbi:hypothetical protein WDU94_004066 [Cyamophila willieti]